MERIFTDQMNQTIRLDKIPSRIVSLVPSQTELLYELGLEEEVVGITKFCIYPEKWFRNKTRVGGTKSLDIDKIRAINPDLIIGNKEENSKEDIEELKKIAPVWMSDIYNLNDALLMIYQVGEIIGKSKNALTLSSEIKENFSQISKLLNTKSVLYFIWQDPYFVAGKNTFVDAMLSECGLINFCNELRYPEWSFNNKKHPDLIFLSTEPYPFKNESIQAFQNRFPNSKVLLVDGEMFSWYGSRLKKAPFYFNELLDKLANQ